MNLSLKNFLSQFLRDYHTFTNILFCCARLGCCVFFIYLFTCISIGACVFSRWSVLSVLPFMILWPHVNTPINLYSTQNRLTHSLYNENYETVDFTHSLSISLSFHFFSGAKEFQRSQQQKRHQTLSLLSSSSTSTHNFWQYLGDFWFLLWLSSYNARTKIFCAAIKLPNKKNDRIISTKTTP